MENKLEKIIDSCKMVSNSSKHVKINYQTLDNMIDNLDTSKLKYWLDTNPFNILDMDVKTLINFLLVYHTIGDYCFWGEPKWETETDIGVLDGSFAMLYLLVNRLKSKNDFKLTFEEFNDLLAGNVKIPLLEDRYNNLVAMNNFLEKEQSDFYSLIKSFTTDNELFEYIIDNLKYFTDESNYNGQNAYFYKRAQLLTSDILHVREIKENIKVDYRNLVGCADYKIPQVMRCYGILEFDCELSYLVDSKIELDSDCDMEIEIRANDIVVIDYIASKLNSKVTRMDINDYIWSLGQDKAKMIKPYHRTLTNKY